MLYQTYSVDANDVSVRKLLGDDRLGPQIVGMAKDGDQDHTVGHQVVAVGSIG
jgi:hypothetical protein